MSGKLEEMKNALYRIRGEMSALKSSRKALVRKAKAAKRITDHAEHVEAILRESRNRLEQGTVKAISRLLTSMMHAVFPEPEHQARRIEVSIIGRGQRQQLSFQLVDADGNYEDVFHGNGGAMTNVVSTGLRIMSAWQSSELANVLFLDEQDCWISPDRAKYYYQVLGSVADALGMQMIVVSHHDAGVFPEGTRIIDLADPDTYGKGGEKSGDEGLVVKSVDIRNFRTHRHLSIGFSPGLNIIHGENNTGKSTVLAAIASVFGANASAVDESVIRHGADEASVEVLLGDGSTWRVVRRRKGTPKTLWFREIDDTQTETGKPDEAFWRLSGIGVDELLAQFGHQKEPVFLLNKPGSTQMKALSIGNEGERLQEIIGAWQQSLRKARSDLREIDQTHEQTVQAYLCRAKCARRIAAGIRRIEKTLAAVEQSRGVVDIAGRALALKTQVDRFNAVLRQVRPKAGVATKAITDLNERLQTYRSMVEYGRKWVALDNEVRALEKTATSVRSKVADVPARRIQEMMTRALELDREKDRIEKIGAVLSHANRLGTEIQKLEKDRQRNERERVRLTSEIKKMVDEMGGVCPLCGGEWNGIMHSH